MNANHDDRDASQVKRALRATPECIPLDRLGETLSARERAHLEGCLRCQTESALWDSLSRAEHDPADGAAAAWIAAELKRRRLPQPVTSRSPWRIVQSTRGLAALAASALLAVTAGYFAWDREPAVERLRNQAPVYRAAQLQVIAPIGDISSVPRTFEWRAVEGAARYDVSILEVDRAIVWQTSVDTTRISVPESVVRLCVPGKTLLWEVTARDRSGAVLAESGTQRFRVALN